MKNIFVKLLVLQFLLPFPVSLFSQTNNTLAASLGNGIDSVRFSEFFINKTLRVDFVMAGNHSSEKVFLDKIKQEPYWGGPQKNLVDPFNSGSFRILVLDSASGKIIFSRGFCNVFQEWQGTNEAKKTDRAFSQSAVMPFPQKTVIFRIEKRAYENGKFTSLFETFINPTNYFIIRENIHRLPYLKFKDSGTPEKKVDVAFISEGYTEKEMTKFLADAQRIGEYFLSEKPYSAYKDRFNFYAIEAPSDESGVDIPGLKVYVNTNLNSSFFTFNTDRYLTSTDAKSIYDIAANVPFDAIVILVNSNKYGGGGFFNYYCETSVDNFYSNKVAIHEFGHSFAGLADEYIGSVNYSDYYNLKVEPWEPNITTNIDFSSKWKYMILQGTPVPTPREDKFDTVVGMFEGGGYMAKDIFSPMMDCRMKTNEAPGFCPVCQAAIVRMIRFYCDE
jgi:hypothetical protein